jgi:GTP-binding protein
LFIDRVKVFVKGGRGGNGIVAFRREKYVPHGGPDGGDGGNGGDVILLASEEKNTLIDLSYRPHLRAANGAHGQGKKKHGKNSAPLYVKVPVGTVVKDEGGYCARRSGPPGYESRRRQGGKRGPGKRPFYHFPPPGSGFCRERENREKSAR